MPLNHKTDLDKRWVQTGNCIRYHSSSRKVLSLPSAAGAELRSRKSTLSPCPLLAEASEGLTPDAASVPCFCDSQTASSGLTSVYPHLGKSLSILLSPPTNTVLLWTPSRQGLN